MPYFNYSGFKIHYVDEGEGHLIVLLPGNTASSAVHQADIDFFSKSFRVVCPDYIGYGKSDRVERFDFDFWWENANLVVELVSSLGIKRYAVIGTSGGGIIALNAAIIKPDCIIGVIADSITGEFCIDFAKAIAEERRQRTQEQCAFWSHAQGPDWEQVVDADTEMILKTAQKGQSLFHGRLSRIKCPVLFTGSLSDSSIPDIENRICSVARQVKTSKVVLYPEGVHPLMWSQAEAFRTEAIRFLQELNETR